MSSVDDALSTLYARLLDGWNRRDAGAMAACFAPHGTMIGFDGSLSEGPAAIESHLSPVFADHPTARFVAIVRGTRQIGDGGLLRADAGMVPPGGTEVNPAANARQVVVARDAGEGWRIELFQNTPAALHWDEAQRETLTRDLDRIVGAGQ